MKCAHCVERDVGCVPSRCPDCETEWCPFERTNEYQSVCPKCGLNMEKK